MADKGGLLNSTFHFLRLEETGFSQEGGYSLVTHFSPITLLMGGVLGNFNNLDHRTQWKGGERDAVAWERGKGRPECPEKNFNHEICVFLHLNVTHRTLDDRLGEWGSRKWKNPFLYPKEGAWRGGEKHGGNKEAFDY